LGNVFVGDHSDKIQLRWLSASNLAIYCDCQIVRLVTNHMGITIEKRNELPQ
jgi:hypothetical protein